MFYLALRNYRFLNIGNLGSADFSVFGLSSASLNQSDLTFLSNASLASAWGSTSAVGHTLTFEWETRFKFLHKSQAKFIILFKLSKKNLFNTNTCFYLPKHLLLFTKTLAFISKCITLFPRTLVICGGNQVILHLS
jgi:hypothetical protein